MNTAIISVTHPPVTATTRSHGTGLDAQSVRDAAKGQWRHIVTRLGIDVPASPKQHGPCPACGGKDRFRFDDQEGRGTWFCNQCSPQAGDGFALIQNVFSCDFPHALETVALEIGHNRQNSKQERPILTTYNYTDEAGTLLFQVVRFEPKKFRQRRLDGHGGWIWNLNGVVPVLYKLPQITPASSILIVEGEKDVDTAYRLGLPDGWAATCNPMGAGKWKESYSHALAGKHIVILPDADEPGEQHAVRIAHALHGKAACISRLTLPQGMKDVSVWAHDQTATTFRELLTTAQPWDLPLLPPNPGSVSALSVPSSEDWPEIQPVKAELLPVDPLPLDIVPVPFQGWVEDVSKRMQCPPDFVAAGMLVMAGAIVGAGCGIRPKKHDDWMVVPNLWGGVVGRPSMLKTPAIGEAMKPLDRLESAAKTAHDTAMKTHDAEYEAYKAQKESLQTDMRKAAKGKGNLNMDHLKGDFANLQEPDAPVWRRYKTNDATIEKMSELQKDNPRGLLLFRDELIGLFATWDKDGHEADRAFYLESWNGIRSYTSDRIGRGTVFVDNLCVSLFGGIQPSKLSGYLHQAMRGRNNDGLVQRLQILVYPDPRTWELIDTPVNTDAKERAYRVVERLASMDFRQYGAFGEENQRIPYYRFNEEAQGVFNEWLTELETKLRREHDEPVLLEHLGKYRSLMPALALLLHVLTLADGQPPLQVTEESAQRAAAWCDYLESHARRAYGLVSSLTAHAASRLARNIQEKTLRNPFTVRDVYRKGWSLLDDRQVIEHACEELVSLGWLRERITPPSPGQRGKMEYHINPNVRS